MAKNTHQKIRPSKYDSPFIIKRKLKHFTIKKKTHIIINKVMYRKILKNTFKSQVCFSVR